MTEIIERNESSPYWPAFQKWVCSACLDCRDDGECGLPAPRTCALRRYLPVIVTVAHRTHSRRMDEYLDAVQGTVCSKCSQQEASGRCTLRDHAECALNAYLPLVLDAIDEVDEAQAGSSH